MNENLKDDENINDANSQNEENSVDEVEHLNNETEEKTSVLQKEIDELNERLLRKAAEFENYKRRTENDQLNLFKYGGEAIISKLLPVIDDFERSLIHIDDAKDVKQFEDGLKLVYQKLMKTLEEQGVKKIECVGELFNVEFHEAILQRPDNSVPAHTILDEVQAGYMYKDKVIRHSQVIVSEDNDEEINNSNGE